MLKSLDKQKNIASVWKWLSIILLTLATSPFKLTAKIGLSHETWKSAEALRQWANAENTASIEATQVSVWARTVKLKKAGERNGETIAFSPRRIRNKTIVQIRNGLSQKCSSWGNFCLTTTKLIWGYRNHLKSQLDNKLTFYLVKHTSAASFVLLKKM